MSVTLGELLNGSSMTMSSFPVQNNLGQEVYPDAQRARGKMSRRDYGVSLHAQEPQEGAPYTMIDDSGILGPAAPAPGGALFGDHAQQLHPYGQHSQYIDDRMAYSAMGPYNSNRTIPSFQHTIGASPAQQAIQMAQQSQNVVTDGRGNRYVQMPDGQMMVLPRQHSAEAVSNAQKRQQDMYGTFPYPPQYAGGVPDLQNAVTSDQSVMLNDPANHMLGISSSEQFGYPRGGGGMSMGCSAALHHVMSCPMCRRYFQCDNKMYIAMMIMLIIIFSILLYMAMKK